jgi:iron complex transport system permease protein
MELIQTVANRISVLLGFTKEVADKQLYALVFEVRMPRIFLACLVGCCLSAAGASYQGIFQNPMAAPDVLGASSGAAFGAALAILLGGKALTITASAFAFSLLTVILVIFISKYATGSRILGLVLSGMMITSLFSAGTSYIKLVADPNEQLPAITYWLMGSLVNAKLSDLVIALIPMVIGLIPLILLRWRMNVLTMGDDEARSIGVNAGRVRLIVIISSTLITAASVSVSGTIGWVGLVVPHLARKIVGNNYIYLMPMTMISGAIFLLLVDDVSRNLMAKEIPLGILTAIIGAPFFIFLMTRKEELV